MNAKRFLLELRQLTLLEIHHKIIKESRNWNTYFRGAIENFGSLTTVSKIALDGLVYIAPYTGGWNLFQNTDDMRTAVDDIKYKFTENDKLNVLGEAISDAVTLSPEKIFVEDPDVALDDVKRALMRLAEEHPLKAADVVKFIEKGGTVSIKDGGDITSYLK